jgi:hypothetical protein
VPDLLIACNRGVNRNFTVGAASRVPARRTSPQAFLSLTNARVTLSMVLRDWGEQKWLDGDLEHAERDTAVPVLPGCTEFPMARFGLPISSILYASACTPARKAPPVHPKCFTACISWWTMPTPFFMRLAKRACVKRTDDLSTPQLTVTGVRVVVNW